MTNDENLKNTQILHFGSIRYDFGTGELQDSAGNIKHLRKRSADVLSFLAANSEQVISKEQLIKSLWPNGIATDDSLIQCIADIRRALGKDSIRTFPKRGYQLLIPQIEKAPDKKLTTPRWLWIVFAGCAVAAVIAIQKIPKPTAHLDRHEVISPPVVEHEMTLAVLPFSNLGGDPEIQYFSDGLSDVLTTDLSKVDGLTVIAFASSSNYPNAEQGFKEIAEELQVRYLVRGTVRHDADRMRLIVSLVDPINGYNIWSDRYDRSRESPFDVQEELTERIVSALSLTLDPVVAETQRIEPGAYYMLLRGLEPLRDFTVSGTLEARSYFERALALDPEYARAHASVAITYGREAIFRKSEMRPESIERGLEAAISAIQIEPDMPHAYYALGLLNLSIEKHATALAAVRHAIHLDANYSNGYALLAEIALYGGDLNEALIAIERAKLLHPNHPPVYHWIEGHILLQLGRYDEAQAFLEAVSDLHSEFHLGLLTLAANYGHQGKKGDGLRVLSNLQLVEPAFDTSEAISKMSYLTKLRRSALLAGLQKLD